jgi:hypothetical protein
MEPKTHFESEDDVKAYFAAQIELWHESSPHPPDHLWERMERARLLSVGQPLKSRRTIAVPDFSNLEFPKIERVPRFYKVKTISKVGEVPTIRAFPQKRYKLKKVSSLPDLC